MLPASPHCRHRDTDLARIQPADDAVALRLQFLNHRRLGQADRTRNRRRIPSLGRDKRNKFFKGGPGVHGLLYPSHSGLARRRISPRFPFTTIFRVPQNQHLGGHRLRQLLKVGRSASLQRIDRLPHFKIVANRPPERLFHRSHQRRHPAARARPN